MTNFSEIKKQLQGEISQTEEDLQHYSRDASIFEIKPEAVIFPKDTKDIQTLVRWAAKEKETNPGISLTARSAGTDMSGGAVNDSIIVDFTKHINQIFSIVPGHAAAEPGVFYRDFEEKTLATKQIMPSYPASKALCALGGIVSNNSGGEKSLSFGKTIRYVEELNVVLSDGSECVMHALSEGELRKKMELNTLEGKIYRETYKLIQDNYEIIQKAKPLPSKNSAGYYLWEVWNKEAKTFDLTKLIVGSQGTLGLVTKIKFKLVPIKPYSQMLVIFLNDLKPLGDIITTVMEHNPETFELFDDHTFNLALKFFPDLLKRMKGGLISLGLKFLPEFWMVLTGGIPKLLLLAEFTGENLEDVMPQALAAQKHLLEKFGLKTHVTKNAGEAEKYWVIRRESFSLLRKHVQGKLTAPFIDDFAVRPFQLPEFLPKLNAILARYPSLIYTIAGHAGDANFHIIPLMDLSQDSERAIIPKLSDEVYDLILQYQGTITAEHNDGLIRTPYLEKMYGPKITELFSEVKNIFDPLHIFNPRKKTNPDMEFGASHIRRH